MLSYVDLLQKNDWLGSMNVSYRINGSSLFRLTVRSTCLHKTVTNIIAVLPGRVEPDRYILFSNHYDAWVKVGTLYINGPKQPRNRISDGTL